MDPKTSDWRPGPTVCRCCLAEGCYKDISTEYFWMGKREVYSEMLSDNLNISIAYSQSGGPNSNSRLICEPCISRLRDASDFRRQVLECEKTFMQHLDPGSTSVQKELQLTLDDVKVERVKLEKKISDDEDFDDRVDFIVDDDDDDLDDEPLMKLATKIPKKELDLLEILDSSQITVKRKATSKAKVPPAKKTKKREIVIKPSASKPSASATKTTEKKKKDEARIMAKRNAEVVLQMSTVYPFRLQGKRIICVYCCDEFEDPDPFRSHVEEKHTKINLFTAFAHIGRHKDYLKVDCTNLCCRICSMPCESIQDIAQHLQDSHTSKLNLNYEIAMHPYKLLKDKWICQICQMKLPSLTKLGRHMSSHYSEYTCDACGRCYLTVDSLKYHIKFSHSQNKILCRKCWKDFPTQEERKIHLQNSIKCRPFGCIHCGERFVSWEAKHRHLVTMHQAQEQTYPCPECDSVFQNRKHFYNHYTSEHTPDALLCTCCGRTFTNKSVFDDHKLGHSGEKLFQCSVCSKSFTRHRNLKQHLWIHSETKRFVCLVCDKQFNQKVCLKGHMKSHHPNVLIEY